MKQYKILGQMKMEKLEKELNRLADDGWRVSVSYPLPVQGTVEAVHSDGEGKGTSEGMSSGMRTGAGAPSWPTPLNCFFLV